MKIITKKEYLSRISKIKAGRYTNLCWISNTMRLDEKRTLYKVCEGVVVTRLTKYKKAFESAIKEIMDRDGCSREEAIKKYEATKTRSVWYEQSDIEGEETIVYNKKDLSKEKPYIQIFCANNVKDISSYHATKFVKDRTAAVRYIVNLGLEDECEIPITAIPSDDGEKLSKFLKKEEPKDVFVKPLSDIIDIGFKMNK